MLSPVSRVHAFTAWSRAGLALVVEKRHTPTPHPPPPLLNFLWVKLKGRRKGEPMAWKKRGFPLIYMNPQDFEGFFRLYLWPVRGSLRRLRGRRWCRRHRIAALSRSYGI